MSSPRPAPVKGLAAAAPDPASLGASVFPGGAFFRVWAPKARRIEAVLDDGREFRLERGDNGYFSGRALGVKAGALYRFRLDGGEAYPDPCSRFQPRGPHGPSQVVDPAFAWTDQGRPGISAKGQVFYEMHVGSFTPEGTFDAAIGRLGELARFGITAIEVMPIAEFPGRFGWGYDGVALWAPYHGYGDPHAFKRFVDAAHAQGLAVVLDVVYNHFGPDGNYLSKYSDSYVSRRHKTDWGAAVNFDGPGSAPVREFFIRNACYWIEEFHCDGLRLDATQNICDDGPVHVLAELSERARKAAGSRKILLVGENEPQNVRCLTPTEKGGYGLDMLWNDDFHHAARVALTGRREAYYTDYLGSPQELISLAKRGFLFQGQYYSWQKQKRGTPVTIEPAEAFVTYLENHDQIANSLRGERLSALASAARYRATAAFWLLTPGTPFFFMGQENGAAKPFLFFADHNEGLAPRVHEGRRQFLSQFSSCASKASLAAVDDPAAPATFRRSVLDPEDRNEALYGFHRELLRLRKKDPVLSRQDRRALDGAVLGPSALALRFFGGAHGDRLLVVNLGTEFEPMPASEPLLAPPARGKWRPLFSSEDVRYGGSGAVNPCGTAGWKLPGESAILFGGK